MKVFLFAMLTFEGIESREVGGRGERSKELHTGGRGVILVLDGMTWLET